VFEIRTEEGGLNLIGKESKWWRRRAQKRKKAKGSNFLRKMGRGACLGGNEWRGEWRVVIDWFGENEKKRLVRVLHIVIIFSAIYFLVAEPR